MAAKLPDSVLDLFERPLLCTLCTVNARGEPHAVPVWCDFDGTHVRVNAPANTKKVRDMRGNNHVAVLLMDPQQAYHWVEIRGHIVEERDESHGARDHINSLSKKYTGNPVYQGYGTSGIDRIMFLVEPDKVNGR